MKAESIKVIFTNLLFVIGVILLIVGFTQGALTVSRLLSFDKYPLQSYEESRCALENARPTFISEEESKANLSDEELAQREARCQESVEQQRKVRRVEDITRAVSFLFAGSILVLFFKRFILK